MARVKDGYKTNLRRKKILKQAKGYYGSKSTLYRTANEQVMNSLAYAYRDRKTLKRDCRKLWITRINATVRAEGLSYSTFISQLKKAGIDLNRKTLSELAINNPEEFKKIIEKIKVV